MYTLFKITINEMNKDFSEKIIRASFNIAKQVAYTEFKCGKFI